MTRRRQQRGMSLVVAIFLVVVVASLAAFAVATTRANSESVNLDVLGSRAQAAAHAGAEWGTYRVLRQNICPGGPQPLTLNRAGLAGFTLTVSCTGWRPTGTYWVADITSEARWRTYGSPDYAYRRVTRRVTNAP